MTEEVVERIFKKTEVKEHLAKLGLAELMDYKKLQERTNVETMMKMMTIGSPPAEMFSDGDQSPLRGAEAQVLRNQWASGLDYDITNEHLTDWLRTLYKGDYSLASRLLGGLSKSQADKLLEKRESLLNVSAVFHVIIGARCLYGDNSLFDLIRERIENKKGHIKILSKLLEMGADLTPKDMAGYTPLHHCLTSFRNSTTLIMAEMLLRAGADPNLQNRFGCSPIFECIMAADVDAIKLLLKYGASTGVKENDAGQTPLKMASSFPKVMQLFSKAGMQKAKDMRAEQKDAAGGSFRLCGGGCGSEGVKRCTGCYMVFYCGAGCQRSAWPGHEAACKTSQAQYRTVDLGINPAKGVALTLNYKTQKVSSTTYAGLPSKKHFVVKIQVPIQAGSGFCEPTHADFMIYNEDRSVTGFLKREGQEDIYDRLNSSIRNRGVNGVKAFYYAIFSGTMKGNEGPVDTIQLKINSELMLPMKNW